MNRRFATAIAATAMIGPLVAGATPANAACYEQRRFTGVSGGIYDIPGGQEKARWFTNFKINVHSVWNSSWIGGNVYEPDNTFRATGYVLKQYTVHSRWIGC